MLPTSTRSEQQCSTSDIPFETFETTIPQMFVSWPVWMDMCTLCALYDQCNAGFVAKKKNENPRCYGWRVGDLGGQNDDCHHQSAARQRGAQYPLEGYPSRIPKKSLEYLVRMSNYVKLYFSGQDVKQYYDGIMMVLLVL